jgi:hypothetical protein
MRDRVRLVVNGASQRPPFARPCIIIGRAEGESLGTDSPFFDRFRRLRPSKTRSVQKNFCGAREFFFEQCKWTLRMRERIVRSVLRSKRKNRDRRKNPYFIALFHASHFVVALCASIAVCDMTCAATPKSLRAKTFSISVMYTLR